MGLPDGYEKHSYLTDDNKDYVNRLGRITRLVLNDLQHNAFHPPVDTIINSARDLENKTLIVKTAKPNDINTIDANYNLTPNFDNEIIVTDTIDSALYFIHYIEQAEATYKPLSKIRPDFVERTLLVQVEWMSRILSKMKHTKAAVTQYSHISSHLPPLFEYLLESVE